MNVPLRDLEEALRNPRAYARKKSTPQRGFYPRSKYLTLQRAVYRFHKVNEDLTKAKQYLEESFDRQFKNQEDLSQYVEKLETYAEGLIRLGTTVFKAKDRLVIPLKRDLATQFRVSGDIPRIDLTNEGYSVWLFAKEPQDWRSEIRLPLIQSAYAKELSVLLNEIRVGVYDFSTGTYKDYGFTQREIKKAENSLVRLLRQLTLE
jgi:hypothetical protein